MTGCGGRGKLTSRFLTCVTEDDKAFVIKQQQLWVWEGQIMSSFWTYFIFQVLVGCLGRDHLYAVGNTDLELSREF